MDNGDASALPDRRIRSWQIDPLARRRLGRIHSWYPTFER